jgi:D-beta-D-heptose 7-phosphate kinase/D-beta-D-heptose 1-phosphate adenosyltransferase
MEVCSATGSDLGDAIGRLSHGSVLVVGDTMLDRYVFGAVHRISPEAPVPVLAVERELALPGGAGNVVRNLSALGAAAALVSVVGDDQAGSDLTGLVGGQINVEPWLLVQSGRCTTVKTRFVADGQQLLRTDQEVTAPIHPRLAERMIRIAGDAMVATSVTILSDYAKGVLAGETPRQLIAMAKAAGRPVVVDTRGGGEERFTGADVLVLTVRALESATEMAVATDKQCAGAARWLCTKLGVPAVVINRRADGLMAVTPDHSVLVPAAARELMDFTGIGDTVVASLAAGLAAGLDLSRCTRVAALAASIAASRVGMAVAETGELLAMLTPQGRAMRKVVTVQDAAEQVRRWRQSGIKSAYLAAGPQGLDAKLGELSRSGFDRLIVGAENWQEADLLAIAGMPDIDLICSFDEADEQDPVKALRPDTILCAD